MLVNTTFEWSQKRSRARCSECVALIHTVASLGSRRHRRLSTRGCAVLNQQYYTLLICWCQEEVEQVHIFITAARCRAIHVLKTATMHTAWLQSFTVQIVRPPQNQISARSDSHFIQFCHPSTNEHGAPSTIRRRFSQISCDVQVCVCHRCIMICHITPG